MAKNSITDYDNISGNNTDVQSVDISEGCSPSGINNAIREVMADLADVNDGTVALTSPQMGSLTVGDSHTIGDDVDDNLEIASSTAENIVIDSAGGTTAFKENGTEVARLTGGALGVGTTNPATPIEISSASNTALRLMNTATNYWDISNDSNLKFGRGGTEHMRIDSSGNLLVGQTTQSFSGNGRVSVLGASGAYATSIGAPSTSGSYYYIDFRTSGGTQTGFIASSNGTSTVYSTSSDYRLKENVTDITGATERLKQLNPVRFNFIADADTTVDGFLAHEVQDVVPEAITGTHNQVEVWTQEQIDAGEAPENTSAGDNKLDDDGNTIPVYQGIDQSKLVPLLVATIQELEARITALEAN